MKRKNRFCLEKKHNKKENHPGRNDGVKISKMNATQIVIAEGYTNFFDISCSSELP